MSETADSVYDQIAKFACAPRCDHLMAVGFAMALIKKLGEDAWTMIDRHRFLGADPAHDRAAHWELVEHSTVDGRFIYDRFFSAVQQLPTPAAVAATISVLVRDLLIDGEPEAARELTNQVRKRLRQHMRSV